MEGQHELSAQKIDSINFKNLAVAPEINCSVFVCVKRPEDVLGKSLSISPEKTGKIRALQQTSITIPLSALCNFTPQSGIGGTLTLQSLCITNP